jgi:type IV pilus assembly protein PilP
MKTVSSPLVRRCLIGLFAVGIAGCGEEEQPSAPAVVVGAKPPVVAAPPSGAPSGAPQTKPGSTWAYDPVGKRDPFRSYVAVLRQQRMEDKERRLEETEKFELDQYQLRGLVTGTAQPSAMVEDPEGKGHVLHVGSKLGRNGGRVTRITSTEIVVTVEKPAPTGERIRMNIQIALPQPELSLEGAP